MTPIKIDLGKPLVVLGFLAAAVILLLNGHPCAGGWCVAGAIGAL